MLRIFSRRIANALRRLVDAVESGVLCVFGCQAGALKLKSAADTFRAFFFALYALAHTFVAFSCHGQTRFIF